MIELQDAYNEQGEKTGELKTKRQIFEDGDWRKVIHVWIVSSKGEMLVQQRVDGGENGIFNNLWDVSVGGGVNAGEEPVVSAKREVAEELGLNIDTAEFRHIGRFLLPKRIPESGFIMKDISETYAVIKDVSAADLFLQEDEVARTKHMQLEQLIEEATAPDTLGLWVPHGPDYYRTVGKAIRELL